MLHKSILASHSDNDIVSNVLWYISNVQIPRRSHTVFDIVDFCFFILTAEVTEVTQMGKCFRCESDVTPNGVGELNLKKT